MGGCQIDNKRRMNYFFFFIYFFTVIWYTVINRSSGLHIANFEPLWSYKAWIAGDADLGREIVANMVMFVPFGFLLSSIISKRRIIILSALIFSCTIEILQLILMRGLFEWDDVISNTVGTSIGLILFQMAKKLMGEKNKEILNQSIGVAFMIICLSVIINEQRRVEVDSSSKSYCFQVDDALFENGLTKLIGFAFLYDHTGMDYSFVLKDENGTKIELEKERVARVDVNKYFYNNYDNNASGFLASAETSAEEYEVLIKWPLAGLISTGVFVSPSGVHYQPEKEIVTPTGFADFITHGTPRVYRPDYHCWVYQYQGSLYWVVDQDFYFEDDGSTKIQYQLWTTQTDKLPKKRLTNGHLWDNIGGYFENYEIEGDWNGYRVMKRELPTEYPITSIVTGYYKDGKWVWKEYFRPYYEF